jgi:ketosteroid isomerase-like protein
MIIRTLTAAGAILLLWSCSASAPARLTDADRAEVRAAVQERMDGYLDAVRRQDLDWMLGFWADTDEFVFAGDGSLIAGYDGFGTQLRAASAATAAVLDLSASNEHLFVLARDVAALSLEFEGTMVTVAGDTVRSRGAWTYVFKQFGDGWKVVHSAGTHVPVASGEAVEDVTSRPSSDSAMARFRPIETREIRPGVQCHHYPRYVVVAWDSPDTEPVAIVRTRGSGAPVAIADCSTDSLAGDFVVRNEWAEYYAGMWNDLLFIDSGTGEVRAYILYDVPSRRHVLTLEGVGEMVGSADSVTTSIWLLRGSGMPRSLCPDITEVFDVGVDSLYAFNLRSLQLTPLGKWRCHQLQ